MTNPDNDSVLSRRQVIKTYAQFVAYFSLCAPVQRLFVGEVSAQSANLAGSFRLDLSVAPFTALQNLNGSVRIEVPNGNGIAALTALIGNAVPSIILTRVATTGDNQFGALGQRCTHQGFAVNAKGTAPNLVCSSNHGGTYNPATGAVVTAPPPQPLIRYEAAFHPSPAPGHVDVSIPGIGYSIAFSTMNTARGRRLRLTFPTKSGATYQVRFRNALTGTDSTIGFFTTQDGVSTVSSINGTGSNLTVFVAPPPDTGFYQIAALP
ncbi:MAG: Rieske (2Fe-2S) protein [Verrucomicrobia subdivision 3 bacterium]|nr:Rieske (2Fe-2S) protein [Limisphaerales bacterium]